MKNKSAQTEMPAVLYQYRPPELWALENLSRCVLHFGSPSKFNDPYDCGIPPRVQNLTEEQYKSMMAQGVRRGVVPLELASKGNAERYTAIFNSHMPMKWHQWCDGLGVACFAKRRDNLLMWSHYSGRGKGFCIAFNTQKALILHKGLIREVQYSGKPPEPLDGSAFLGDGTPEGRVPAMLDFLAHKPEDWKYEQEWRVFMKIDGRNKEERDKNRRIGYDWDALKAIYFGTETEDETKAQICATAIETYPNTELWQGRLSESEYKVEFDQIR